MTRHRWIWATAILSFVALAVGIFLRFYWLSFHSDPALYAPMKNRIFDEVYFPVFASDYLHGKNFYDVHPPLGKLIIALGEWIFGDNGIGWRIMPCLFGLANIALMAAICRRLFKENFGAIAIVGFLALDGLFICYSRTGLMDGILFFATFFCIWTAARLESDKLPGLLTAVALGLAISVKWTALSAIVPMLWFAWRYQRLKPFFAWLPLTALIYFSIVVFGQWRIGAAHPIAAAIDWHKAAAIYHMNLQKNHPWGSQWWSWPLELRPVLLLYDRLPNHQMQVMTTLANPLLLWGSTVTVLGTTVWYGIKKWKAFFARSDPVPEEKEDVQPTFWARSRAAWNAIAPHPTFPLVIGFFASWLPFAPVHRVMFFYHYMPAYGFGLLLVAYWMGVLAKRSASAAFVLCGCAAAMAWYLMPFALGYPKLTKQQVDMRTLIPRWL